MAALTGPSHATFVLAGDGRVTQPSASFGQLVGVDLTRVVGQLFVSLVANDDIDRFVAVWSRARESGEPVTCPLRLRCSDDRMRSVEILLVPVPDGADGLVVAVVRDPIVSARSQLEARLLRRITEAANDTSETQVLFDRAMADIMATMGWQSARVLDVDADLRPAASGDPAGRVSTAATKAFATGMAHAEIMTDPAPTALGRDGARQAIALPIVGDDGVITVLEFLSDTAVDLDDDLRSLFTSLGRQLGSVVDRQRVRRVLDERTAELERSNGELERFAHVASHDLQEPIRKIVGFSDLLGQRYDEHLDDTGREYIGYVVDGAHRMQNLIRGLLAYSKTGRTLPAFERVDLEVLVAEVLDMLEWTLDEAAARVTVGPLPTVWGDAGQLAEVVTNLITNAAKYATDGGAAIALAAIEADASGEWEITVSDDGIGIDPQYDEQIFEVFRRLHGPTEYSGTGIGLAITRRFVQAHGGRIWVTPNEPCGSVFHFTVPALQEEPT